MIYKMPEYGPTTQRMRFAPVGRSGVAKFSPSLRYGENVVYARNVRLCENNHAVKDMKLLKKSMLNLILFFHSK